MISSLRALGSPYVGWLIAHACNQLGVKFAAVALPLIALKEADASTAQMGVITAASSISYVLLALPVGARIETLRKQSVVAWSGRIRMLACVWMVLVLLSSTATFVSTLVFSLIVGACSVVYDIGLGAGLPERVTEDQLTDANRGFEVVQHSTTFIGPALAAAVVLITSPAWIVLGEAAVFGIASLAASISRPVRATAGEVEERLVDRLRSGISFAWNRKVIRQILVTILVSNFAATVILTLEPVLILNVLDGDSLDLALCLMAGSLGGLAAAGKARSTITRMGRRPVLIGGLLGAAVCTGGIATASGLAGQLPSQLLIGLCALSQFGIAFSIVHFNIVQVTVRQEITPLHYMARMSSVSKFFIWSSMPIASLTAGWAAEAWGLVGVMWAAFAIALITATLVLRVDINAHKTELARV
ncbi:MFS transporter [Janibacter anophelis]|uniref:MFS transporter n=1 Tax=Janibacter anophelis TaxID=319054 RepID=UPI003F810DD2